MIKQIVLYMMMLFISTAAGSGVKVLVIDDCDDGNHRTLSTGWWYTYTDSADGGNSKVVPAHGHFSMDAPGYLATGKAAHVKGFAGNKLGWDYAGIGFTLSNNCGCPVAQPLDISEFDHIAFALKGTITGGRFVLVLQYTENKCNSGQDHPETLIEWADYEADLTGKITPEWSTIRLSFRKDFRQPNWTKKSMAVPVEQVLRNSKNLNFHFSSPDGDSIDVWIDDIVLTR